MKTYTILITILLAVLSMPGFALRPIENEEYTKMVFTDSSNKTMPYRMLSPTVKDGETYPLVVFLHGSGERGNDNEKQLAHGASTFSNPSNSDKYPAFVIFPQCKDKSWTSSTDARSFMPGSATPPITDAEKMVVDLVKQTISEYPIDPARVYIVGISMGGIAAYDLACRFPDVFAAAVPICGAVNPDRLMTAKDVNFMIFHGEDDDEVPNICGREAYKALNAAGASVRYVEFAGAGHDCWDSAFNYPDFLPWLFSQTKVAQKDNYADLSSSQE